MAFWLKLQGGEGFSETGPIFYQALGQELIFYSFKNCQLELVHTE